MDTQNDIKQKETLLKSEIIDKNFDKDKFITFCTGLKQDGDDISKWTLEELRETVREFQKQFPVEREKDAKNKADEELKKDIDKIDVQEVSETKQREKSSSVKNIEISCKVLPKSILNDIKVVSTIKNPKPVQTSFFQSNYISYEIHTPIKNWVVHRRYSDFEWLRSVLSKFNPGILVPPIPEKKYGQSRFDVEFVAVRMKYLQKFLDDVLVNETFKASEALISFLSIVDQRQFEYKMKELSSVKVSSYIQEFKTLDGKITVSEFDSEEDKINEKYYVNIKNYFKIQGKILDKLTSDLSDYNSYTIKACECLHEVQKNFEILHLLNVRVGMRDQITKTYEEYGVFFRDWKKVLTKQNDLFKEQIAEFFKLMRLESTAYSELIYQREDIKSKYISEKSDLTQKKEKLFALGDINKWEITDFSSVDVFALKQDKTYAFSKMCTQATNKIKMYENLLSYYNRQNMNELKKLFQENAKRYLSKIKEFTEEFYPTLTDSLNIYSKLQIFVSKNNIKQP